MKPNNEKPRDLLNRAAEEIRNASAAPESVEGASARVLHHLQAEYNKVVTHPASADAAGSERIQSCEDFRALIPAYLSSSLTPSRQLLLSDHTRECAGCRKALAAARGQSETRVASGGYRPARRVRWVRWAAPLAAALLVVVSLQFGPVRDWIWPVDVHAIAQAVDGGLYMVSGQQINAIRVGHRIERDQAVRTGNDSGAVLELADGSRIEMAARSELFLDRGRDGVKIRLERGNVIVTAAKQRAGHLYVETGDCMVSVVGTVFAVGAGVKGSRVTVVEGEVRVEYGGTSQAIRPGQQAYTNPDMGAVPLEQEVAWSRDAEALLREVAAFGQDFAKRVESAEMRFTSSLVPLVGEDTFVFASLPNVSQPFSESYSLFRRRINENPNLATWWKQYDGTGGGVTVDELATMISHLGSLLGPEVVFAFPKEMGSRAPVMLASTNRDAELLQALERAVPRLDSEVRFARNAAELAAVPASELVIYVENGLLVMSTGAQARETSAIRSGQVSNKFSSTPLYHRLEQAYQDGVGWLLAADLRQIVPAGLDSPDAPPGLEDVQQLVLEQKTGLGKAASRAGLGFSQTRHGIASWLAEPSPMGALEFVSPEAYAVSAAVVKDPALILDDLFSFVQKDADAWEHLQQFQQEQRVDIRHDLAEPLGNEVLIAFDGPILPTPSWKVVMEVIDAPRLENTLQWLVTSFNREAAAEGRPLITLTSETVDGLVFYTMTTEKFPLGLHYTFWRGYLIVAPSRPLLTEAIRIRDSGNTLGRSAILRAEMPPENRDYFSALMYQNVQAMVGTFGSEALRDTFGQPFDDVFLGGLPRLVCVFGEPDRILASARGSFGVNLAGMFTLQGVMSAAGFHSLPN